MLSAYLYSLLRSAEVQKQNAGRQGSDDKGIELAPCSITSSMVSHMPKCAQWIS